MDIPPEFLSGPDPRGCQVIGDPMYAMPATVTAELSALDSELASFDRAADSQTWGDYFRPTYALTPCAGQAGWPGCDTCDHDPAEEAYWVQLDREQYDS